MTPEDLMRRDLDEVRIRLDEVMASFRKVIKARYASCAMCGDPFRVEPRGNRGGENRSIFCGTRCRSAHYRARKGEMK